MLKPLFTHLELIEAALQRGDSILTPNRRLARSVIAAVDESYVNAAHPRHTQASLSRAWRTPIVTPVQQYWVDEYKHAVLVGALTPHRLLSRDEQRYVWQQVIEADPSPEFSLLSPSAAASLCQQASESLVLWMQDLSDQNLRARFSFDQDCEAFLRWHDAVQSRYREIEADTTEAAISSLLLPAASGVRERHLTLLAADDLPPLLVALCNSADSLSTVPMEACADDSTPLSAYSFPDSRSELTAAARWCREQATANPQNRYAVVLADMTDDRDRLEQLLRREFDCLTGNYESLPVNFATGFALPRVPMIRDALRILATSQQLVRVDETIAVLQSRFISLGTVDHAALAKGFATLRDLAQHEVPASAIRTILAPCWIGEQRSVLQQQLKEGRPLHRQQHLPSMWVKLFAQILESWGWPGRSSLDSLEFQQLQRWQDALDDFATKDAVTGVLDLDAVLAFFARSLAGQQFQPKTADQAIQVLGPKELVGLSFDGIWLTRMNAGAMPEPPRPNPYMPNSLQRELLMPGADAHERLAQAERRWRHWSFSTDSICCSYQREIDGTEALPSPFVDTDLSSAEPTSTIDPRWQEQSQDTRSDAVDPGFVSLQQTEHAAGGVGAHVLEAQANCPFKAFASARLAVAPTSSIAPGLLPSERGTMLHRALYLLYNDEQRPPGDPNKQTSRHPALGPIAERAVQAISAERRELLGMAALDLESRRLVQVLEEWLVIDAKHLESFSIRERETACEGSVGGLNFRLRIDRVDCDAQGNEILIDYKSASIESSNHWFQSPPTRPQLPLYACIRSTAKGVAIASLKPGEMAIKGVSENLDIARTRTTGQWLEQLSSDANFDSLRNHWQAELESLAHAFLEGASDVDPTADACRYCQRFELCRYSELAV